jgi:uncharacterized alpha-E superfamily protein
VDETNPKSLAFQCSRLATHVEHLPRQHERRFGSMEERMALQMLTSVRLLDLSNLECSRDNIPSTPLTDFLTTMETRLKAFAQQVSAHYLSRVPTTPHFSIITGERKI